MEKIDYADQPKWKKILFSRLMLECSGTRKIVYIAVMVALSIVSNCFFTFFMGDVQFSLTMYVGLLTGVILGPVFGFCASFLGDFVGYIYNSWGMIYMPWVGLSSAVFSLLAGLFYNTFPTKTKLGLFTKTALLCLATLFICTIGITTTGLYFYNLTLGFSKAVVEYCSSTFGSEATYLAYVAYRMIFRGQIFNNILNYALFFVTVPLLNSIKALKINIS